MPRERMLCSADKGPTTETTPTVVMEARKTRRGNGDDKRLKDLLTHSEHRYYLIMAKPLADRCERSESEGDTSFTLQTTGI